jgi:hypothetical protein
VHSVEQCDFFLDLHSALLWHDADKNELGETTLGEGDVALGGEKSDQANNAADDGFQ